jgi:uncharacterized membrane protein YkvI
MNHVFRAVLLPALVFQSIIVAGGYGTGQELIVFFLSLGPAGGLAAMILAAVIISLSAVICFEFARLFQTTDYRSFFQLLLGRYWFVWEIGFLIGITIFFAMLGSAAGEIFTRTFGIPHDVGTLSLMLVIALLVFWGSSLVEKVCASWSFVLYLTYLIFFVWMLNRFSGNILPSLQSQAVGSGWIKNGAAYAGLQISVLPTVLFSLRHVTTRKRAIGAGLLVGPVALIPAVLFYFAMLTHYPQIEEQVLPSNYLLESLGSRWFQILFQIVLLGSLIDTGAGVIHAFNERLASLYRSLHRNMPRALRPSVAVILMLTASLLSKLGLVKLILLSASTFAWFSLIVFLVPLFTVGIAKIRRADQAN